MLNAFDELENQQHKYPDKKINKKEFFKEYNRKNGLSYSYKSYMYHFKKFIDDGEREPIPKRKSSSKKWSKTTNLTEEEIIKAAPLYEEYKSLVSTASLTLSHYRDEVLYEIIADKFGYSKVEVGRLIKGMKKLRNPLE